ncbi:hypothetical protein BJX99DRAFT_249616 [Aspergillus californicus]
MALIFLSQFLMRLFTALWPVSALCLAVEQQALTKCDSTAVRKEWTSFTTSQRTEYISSVQCMIVKPPLLDGNQFPGVRIHINYTLNVHVSGIFLPCHRQYLWLWEQALKDECGYSGYLPFVPASLSSHQNIDFHLATSPLFDGSDTSLSGDGIYDPNEIGFNIDSERLPRGTGGGCVASGPFQNHTVHMGPFKYNLTNRDSLPDWAFAYNPRCFTRSLNTGVLARFNSQDAINALLAAEDIIAFQRTLDSFPNPRDCVAGDPAFMLHYAMVDRLWGMWQDVDRDGRVYQTNGTSSFANKPRTEEVTLETNAEFGILGSSKRVGDLMDSRQYCYVYE